MPLEIWLPNGTAAKSHRPIIDRCRVPVGPGKVCGHIFFEGEEHRVQQHIVDCCAQHEAEIRAERQRQHPDIMKPWDPEFYKWVRTNSREIMEGRKKVGGGVS